MKKVISMFLAIMMVFSAVPMMEITAFAEAGVAVNKTNFPDAIFRAYVQKNFDTDGNSVLSNGEFEIVTQMYVYESDITSLKGIEYFTALTFLDCGGNQLTSLDVSKNTALTYLNCGENQLTSLDVSKNAVLDFLDCGGNQFTSLDVSKNTALTYLDCQNNQLTSLDVSKNTALTNLNCGGNQLTSLDVSKNTALTDLYCSSNQLTSLDLSRNTALISFHCYENQLVIEIGESNTFDLSTLPGNFDASKASNWSGASVNGNILTVNEGVDTVTYTYDMGNRKSEKFSLMIEKPEPTPENLVGDVNGDGIIDASDYAMVISYVMCQGALTEEQEKFADWNKDGAVDGFDAIAIDLIINKVIDY